MQFLLRWALAFRINMQKAIPAIELPVAKVDTTAVVNILMNLKNFAVIDGEKYFIPTIM
jgi:hypothetical protein